MRVTQLMLQRTLLADVNRARTRLADTQERASSGLLINRPSDGPSAAGLASRLRADLEVAAQLQRSLAGAEARLATADRALQDATDTLVRARELAIQAASDTQDASSRRLISEEIRALHEQLVSIGNTSNEGAFLFSGYRSTTPAFTPSGPFVPGLPAPSVGFSGDSNEVETEVEPGVRLATTLDGRRVFMGDADGDGTPESGREDLFDTLGELWEALQNDDRAAVAASLDRIDVGLEQLQAERTRNGGRLTRLESAREERERREVDLRARLSQVQDADSVVVFSDLVLQETLLRASLEATAGLIQPTLLDFLG